LRPPLKPLLEVVRMSQIFWMQHHRWPRYAAELLAFSEEWKWPLSLSGFHLLVFTEKGSRELVIEFALEDSGQETATCGQLELRNTGLKDRDLSWELHHRPLPARPFKKVQYCLIPQAR